MAEINSSPYKGSAQNIREQLFFYEMRITAKFMHEGLDFCSVTVNCYYLAHL